MTCRSPKAVVATVLTRACAAGETARLAHITGCDQSAAHRELRSSLQEMAGGRRPWWTEMFARILQWCVVRRWEVCSAPAERESVRRLAASGTVVFLPSHRSHADPLFLAQVVRECGLPRPTWFAGDNLRLPLLTAPARRAAVVFLRRTAHGDEVYHTALRLYLGHLIEQGHPLEWYQEGGRTRTGLPQPPRLGLLTRTLEAVREDTGRPVWFVPVALTHVPVPDAMRLADEEDGWPKAAESLRWFLRYVRQQRPAAGRVDVRFGTPFEAGAYAHRAEGDLRQAARVLGRDVARAICRATPVRAEAVAALVLTGRSPDMTVLAVHRRTQPLLDALERCDAPGPPPAELRTLAGVRDVLERLHTAGALTMTGSGDRRQIRPVARIAALHRNQGVHWFWPRALAELAALRAARTPAPGAWEHGVRELRLLLDLVTCGTGLESDPFLLATAVVELQRLAVGDRQDEHQQWVFDEQMCGAGALIAPDVLNALLTAQVIVFRHLSAHTGPLDADRAAVLSAALSDAGVNNCLRSDRPDAASPHLYRAILLDAQRRGLLAADTAQSGLRRGWAARANAALDDLRTLTRLAEQTERSQVQP
ncbi:1-acyl-sn-glycerol-3-phosphate acyltransferase [Streptomyces longwoodensis]|uniref:1-acyl-sn-glycerol-3-phosphate acyltransferase n=1 Tax=Streptomyces longwoodensis TaxID=68231 RepID=UPI0033F01FD6